MGNVGIVAGAGAGSFLVGAVGGAAVHARFGETLSELCTRRRRGRQLATSLIPESGHRSAELTGPDRSLGNLRRREQVETTGRGGGVEAISATHAPATTGRGGDVEAPYCDTGFEVITTGEFLGQPPNSDTRVTTSSGPASSAQASELTIRIPIHSMNDAKSADVKKRLREMLKEQGVDRQQLTGDPVVSFTCADGKTISVSDADDLKSSRLPGEMKFVYQMKQASPREMKQVIDTDNLLKQLLDCNTKGKMRDETSFFQCMASLAGLKDGTWVRRSSAKEGYKPNLMLLKGPDGTIRLYVPRCEEEKDYTAVVNALVLDESKQGCRKYPNNVVLFSELDWSEAKDDSDAAFRDFAVTFENERDRDKFLAKYSQAKDTNRKLLGRA